MSTETFAQDLAAKGLPVFPLGGDKRPLTKHGFHDATTNPNKVGNWWWQWPGAMIGVPTGGRLCAVDLDLQHAEARDWLAANRETLPTTRTHHTRSGGQHLLFQAHPAVKSTASKIAMHVDTRGTGGYIVWWPGEGLGVENPFTLAAVPAFIIDALKTPERDAPPPSGRRQRKHGLRDIVINNTIDSVVRTIATASEGARNSLTYWGACRLAELVYHGAIEREDAMALVVEAASRTGLPAFEARLTALSAFRRVATEGPRPERPGR
jgi:hypothetical protein